MHYPKPRGVEMSKIDELIDKMEDAYWSQSQNPWTMKDAAKVLIEDMRAQLDVPTWEDEDVRDFLDAYAKDRGIE